METRNHIKGMVFAALFAALTAAVAPIKIPLGFTPVPITLQTLMVLLAGAMLGSRLGALSQIIYILLGVIGLPAFAGGASGIGALFGPTGGFLIGFIVAAFVIGLLVERTSKLSFRQLVMPLIILLVSSLVVGSMYLIAFKNSIFVLPFLGQRVLPVTILCAIIITTAYFISKHVNLARGAYYLQIAVAMIIGTLIIYTFGAIGGLIATGLPLRQILFGWVLPFLPGDAIKLVIASLIAYRLDINKYMK